jgi:8-oxo-dGTP diphosphatase
MQLRDAGQGKPIPYPNTWNFPGGRVEQGETPLAAGIREIAEEFEILLDASACRKVWMYTHDHAEVDHVFLCAVPANATPILHEGAAYAWMMMEQIADLQLGFDQAKILSHIPR